MKHCYLTFLVFFLGISLLQAQQTPMFTQYRENYSLINPAIINADRMAFDFTPNSKASLGYRSQWNKMPDGPKTFTGQYEHLFDDKNMGVGAYITSDALGPISMTGLTLRYNYQAYFSDYTYLSLGVSTGGNQYSYRGTLGKFIDAGDNVGFLDYNRILWDFNLGASFVSELANNDVFYTSLSAPQIYTADFESRSDAPFTNGTLEKFNVNQVSHLYFLLGYYKYLTEGLGSIGESVFLEPSLWIKYAPNAPVQADAHLRFQVTNAFWFGGGMTMSYLDKYRSDNVHIEAGFNVQSQQYYNSDRAMKIGFGYDSNISAYGGAYLGGAFEVNMTYSFAR
jgi:type IX secretion system PorP/SprF family membrane protein